jgi:hypothetical protein
MEISNEEIAEIFETQEVPEFSAKFTKEQNAGPRVFVVTGPKADKVRKLIFADRGLTRKEIATIANCSVSRVGEVVWGLENDELDFPAIPLRAGKATVAVDVAAVVEVIENTFDGQSTDIVDALERGLAARENTKS